jgi:hypothetical protein
MKLYFTLTLLIALFTTLALSASDYENAIICGKKEPATNAAISAFCSNRGPKGRVRDTLLVPSLYAHYGILKKAKMKVFIRGKCSPPQWVPLNYCNSQFHEMCAQSPYRWGEMTRKYGNGGCQTWTIKKTGR